MSKSYTTSPIVSVPFSSGYYMCVESSPRHEALNRASHAFNMGYRSLAEDLKQEALSKPGCAFEARENEAVERSNPESAASECQQHADICFETLVANNKKNN